MDKRELENKVEEQIRLPLWAERSLFEKVISFIQMALVTGVIVLLSFQILDIWKNAINVLMPLLGLVFVLGYMQYIKYHKMTAYAYLGTGVLIFAECIFVLLQSMSLF